MWPHTSCLQSENTLLSMLTMAVLWLCFLLWLYLLWRYVLWLRPHLLLEVGEHPLVALLVQRRHLLGTRDVRLQKGCSLGMQGCSLHHVGLQPPLYEVAASTA